jgi:hypothetical protein
MRRWLLAIVALFGVAVANAYADYVIIKLNLAVTKEKQDQQTPQQQPGFPGMAGMPAPGMGGMQGMQGAPRQGQGGGFKGGQGMPGAGGVPNMGSAPMPGMGGMGAGGQGMQGMGGRPGMGAMGGQGMGGYGMQGMQGMGMQGGMPGAMGAGNAFTSQQGDDESANPFIVGAVIEVKHENVHESKLTGQRRIDNPWGGKTTLYMGPGMEVRVIRGPTVLQTFESRYKQIKTDDPSRIEKLLDLARWGLTHGLLDKVESLMEELSKLDTKIPAVVAFQKVRADMSRKIQRDDDAIGWKDRLGDFSSKSSTHYTLLYDGKEDSEAADLRLKRLENNYRGFFYWFAMEGRALPVPDYRLVAVLISNRDAFEQKHKDVFDDTLVVEDAFYARRDNLAIFAAEPLDDGYQGLEKFMEITLRRGAWDRPALLSGKAKRGRTTTPSDFAWAETLTLLEKAMQQDAEVASASHEGTQQLIAAVGLLPRSIEAPRWLDFGMASFFETPKESFWYTVGGPHVPYLLTFKKWETAKKLEKDAVTTMRAVVSDRYFRHIRDGKQKDKDLTRARTLSWALTYFLVKRHPDYLLKYYEELRALPRDLELDEDTLLSVFAHACKLVDPAKANELDINLWTNFANAWYQFLRTENPEISLEGGESPQRKPAGRM